jgi:hypothetical protein
MHVLASELSVGDAIRLNDWNLHVVAVAPGGCATVRTAEFDFLLHFDAQDYVDVLRAADPRGAAA